MRPFYSEAQGDAYEDVHVDPAIQRLHLAIDRLQHVTTHVKMEVRVEVGTVDRVVDRLLVFRTQHAHTCCRIDIDRDITNGQREKERRRRRRFDMLFGILHQVVQRLPHTSQVIHIGAMRISIVPHPYLIPG